jgi:dihydrofolate reductase
MRKLIVSMHMSLDGFVAGPGGEMDWIHVAEDMFDFVGQFTEEADMALYGRITYQMMEAYWPTAGAQPGATKHDIEHADWYNHVPKVVMSKTLDASGWNNNTTVIRNHLAEEINKIKHMQGKNILLFGSPGACHALMGEGLIDEFWLFVNPVVLGAGIPMFQGVPEPIKLTLAESKMFSGGVVALHYLKQ